MLHLVVTADVGRLIVDRASAGARAVTATEELHRAEDGVRQGRRGAEEKLALARTAFATAFQAYDVAHIALYLARPAYADPERHRESVAFVLRSRTPKAIQS